MTARRIEAAAASGGRGPEVDEREEQLVERAVPEGLRRLGVGTVEVVGARTPATQRIAVDGIDAAANAEIRRRSHPRNTERRRRRSLVTIAWTLRRALLASARTRPSS